MTTNNSAVALLLTTAEGAPVAVRFANRAAAEAFEAHHGLNAEGVLPIITQAEAVLRGCLR